MELYGTVHYNPPCAYFICFTWSYRLTQLSPYLLTCIMSCHIESWRRPSMHTYLNSIHCHLTSFKHNSLFLSVTSHHLTSLFLHFNSLLPPDHSFTLILSHDAEPEGDSDLEFEADVEDMPPRVEVYRHDGGTSLTPTHTPLLCNSLFPASLTVCCYTRFYSHFHPCHLLDFLPVTYRVLESPDPSLCLYIYLLGPPFLPLSLSM
jgi:hypothetical protein